MSKPYQQVFPTEDEKQRFYAYLKQIKALQLDPQLLRTGKHRCVACERPMRAHAKTLDKRLVRLALEIQAFVDAKRRKMNFNPREIWADHHKITDFQKLQYFRIINHTDRSGWWQLTDTGRRFLDRKLRLPTRVWVYEDRRDYDDHCAYIDEIDPRWQYERSHYSLDYVPAPAINKSHT